MIYTVTLKCRLGLWWVPGASFERRRRMREAVRKFAEIMERKLKENDHKGGWEGMRFSELIQEALWEIWEIGRLCARYKMDTIQEKIGKRKRKELQREAADVANFMMMISDNLENYEPFDSEL